MDITGRVMIYRKDFENNIAYSTSIKNTTQDGAVKRLYISVQLPKGTILEDKTPIDVSKGFLTFYVDNKGYEKVKIVVMEFTTEKPTDVTNDVYDGTMVASGDELPF